MSWPFCCRRLAQDLDMRVVVFNHFGKNVPKTHNMSPDAFIQIALQLAYYRWVGKVGDYKWLFINIPNSETLILYIRWLSFDHVTNLHILYKASIFVWLVLYCMERNTTQQQMSFLPLWSRQDVPALLSHLWKCFPANVSTGPHRNNPVRFKCFIYFCQGLWWSQQTGQNIFFVAKLETKKKKHNIDTNNNTNT